MAEQVQVPSYDSYEHGCHLPQRVMSVVATVWITCLGTEALGSCLVYGSWSFNKCHYLFPFLYVYKSHDKGRFQKYGQYENWENEG